MFAPWIVNHLHLSARRITAYELHRNLGSLDGCARNSRTIGEVAQTAGYRPPAAANARLRHARLSAIRGLLIDDEVERHVLREQLGELPIHVIARIYHARR